MERRSFIKSSAIVAGLGFIKPDILSNSFSEKPELLCGDDKKAFINEPRLELVFNSGLPVVTTRHPDAIGIKFGFEGGKVVKLGSTYHLFTSEMVADPIWVKMKLGYWRSEDGLNWKRISTLYESSGEFEGKDPRAALWSPLPVYDEEQQFWNLFYVAYHSAPGTLEDTKLNHNGRIWQAVSLTPGKEGIGGPYRDHKIVLSPGADSDPWEGTHGVHSFYPYRVGDIWYAFYGSCGVPPSERNIRPKFWWVGLATAPHIGGPWTRLSAMNPVRIEKTFIENPIVIPLPSGGYLCVYESTGPDVIGYAYSADGIHWNAGHNLGIQPNPGVWAKSVRTPLGMVSESNDEYLIYYTGFETEPDWNKLLIGNGEGVTCAIGLARVRLII